MKKVRIVNLRMERHGMSTKTGGGISRAREMRCRSEFMNLRTASMQILCSSLKGAGLTRMKKIQKVKQQKHFERIKNITR